MRRSLVAATISALAMTGGCSWIFVQPLPADRGRFQVVSCTTSQAAPVLDTLLAITNAGSAIYVAAQDNVTNKTAGVLLGLGVATLWGLSAGYGYIDTSECRDAVEDEGRSYHPLPHLRAPPQYYPQPPSSYAAPRPAPYAPPGSAPAVPPEPALPSVRSQDNDEPRARPAVDPDVPLEDRPRPKKVPEKLDAPRFGS